MSLPTKSRCHRQFAHHGYSAALSSALLERIRKERQGSAVNTPGKKTTRKANPTP